MTPVATPRPSGPSWLVPLLLYVGAAAGLVVGAYNFWFLTDDAFIAFRYVHNAVVGRGLVWNPAPFLPVEGYTSFSWVVILVAIERLFGVSPPVASNWLGLGLGLLSLGLVVRVLLSSTCLPARWHGQRVVLAGLVLLGLLCNRTYLTWHTSGLETPLFNALLTAWLALLVTPWGERDQRRLFALCGVAALTALTRPDGMLFVAASVVLVVSRATLQRRLRLLSTLAPLVLVLLHLAWRRHFYGQWLPNTYYAKYSSAWPASGMRYFGSFVIEYGLYVPLGLAAWLGVKRLRALRQSWSAASWRAHLDRALRRSSEPRWIAWGAVGLHIGSLTLVIGGDHFEYRPYSYLVPWLWLGCLRLVASCCTRWLPAVAWLVAMWLVSLPIPWLHFAQTRSLATREQTHFLHARVAPHLPAPFSYVAEVWDEWQGWLVAHYVCMRHQEHKVFLIHQLAVWQTRAEGEKLAWSERNVLVGYGVGVPGWVFPNVAVLDALGLNDFVIARTHGTGATFRRMAHDRWPPNNYLRCFRPNVDGFWASYRVVPRRLKDDDIRACEQRFRSQLKPGD